MEKGRGLLAEPPWSRSGRREQVPGNVSQPVWQEGGSWGVIKDKAGEMDGGSDH